MEDHCAALDAALHVPIEDIAGQPINVGSDRATSVLDITHVILDQLNKPHSLIEHMVDRPGQVDMHHSDSQLAQQLLGWCATTDLHEGLGKTIAWYKENTDCWKSLERKQFAVPQQSKYTSVLRGARHRGPISAGDDFADTTGLRTAK